MKLTIDKANNNMDMEPITVEANNDIDIGVNMNELDVLSRVINNIDAKFNIDRLGKANKIIKKETKIYKPNLF